MATVRKEVWPSRLPEAAVPPIKYLTENGFIIIRLSEVDPTVHDSPGECRFLVSRDDAAEQLVEVGFDEMLVATLCLRRRIPLSESSRFWVVCAESCLARYLWENDSLPPGARMHITELCPDDLMLALHWRD
jgi:hypothetical protein